jgi:predicted HAD superfamily hydrolase
MIQVVMGFFLKFWVINGIHLYVRLQPHLKKKNNVLFKIVVEQKHETKKSKLVFCGKCIWHTQKKKKKLGIGNQEQFECVIGA